MTSVRWSPESIRDVESIRAFIAQDSPVYAELVARRIVAAVERLHFFPESGRIVPERQEPEIREVIIAPITVADVTYDLARESGFASVDDVLRIARHGSGDRVYLIRFHYLPPGAWDTPKWRHRQRERSA